MTATPTELPTKRLPKNKTFEALELDGYWMTKDAIIFETGQTEPAVRNALLKLQAGGWIEWRYRLIDGNDRVREYKLINLDYYYYYQDVKALSAS